MTVKSDLRERLDALLDEIETRALSVEARCGEVTDWVRGVRTVVNDVRDVIGQCGTRAGYQAHHARGEKACTDCSEANNAYHADYRERTGSAYKRPYQRAWRRAAQRLTDKYRSEFTTLMAEERFASAGEERRDGC